MEPHAQLSLDTAHGGMSARAKMCWLDDGATQRPLLRECGLGISRLSHMTALQVLLAWLQTPLPSPVPVQAICQMTEGCEGPHDGAIQVHPRLRQCCPASTCQGSQLKLSVSARCPSGSAHGSAGG